MILMYIGKLHNEGLNVTRNDGLASQYSNFLPDLINGGNIILYNYEILQLQVLTVMVYKLHVHVLH